MAFATGYQTGLNVPNPYTAIMDRRQRERESARTAGIQQYAAQTGRMRLGVEEKRADSDRAQREMESARTAGIQKDAAESLAEARKRTAGISQQQADTARFSAESAAEERKSKTQLASEQREWVKSQKKDQDEYDEATRAILRGDYDAASRFFIQHAADVEGIDLKGTTNPYENALAVQKLLSRTPKITKTEKGVSILYPGTDAPQEYSPQTFMGEFWGPQNPKHRTQTIKEAAETRKVEAETRKIERGDLSEKDRLAREKFAFEKKKALIDYPELAGAGIDAGIDAGGPADSAQIDIPAGHKLQRNRRTGATRVVPIVGGGGGIVKPVGADNTQTDIEKITQFNDELKQYLDTHPIEQAARPVPERTGVVEPTANVSTGIASPQTGFTPPEYKTITSGDISGVVRSGISRLGQGMDEATMRLQEAADRRSEYNYNF